MDPIYQLRLEGIPEKGAKSRVETQIKLTLYLESKAGLIQENVYDRIGIPDLLIANSRWKLNSNNNTPFDCKSSLPYHATISDFNKCVWLRGWLQCASDPNKVVRVCPTCVLRETRRTALRKSKPTSNPTQLCPHPKFGYSHFHSPDQPGFNFIDDLTMSDRKTILVHAPALMDFSSGKAFLPIRLPCYSRHQNEKTGFIMHFQLVNVTNQVVAEGQTPPILITDDHKSTIKKPSGVPPPVKKDLQQQVRVNKRKRILHPLSDLRGIPGMPLPSPCTSPTVPWSSCMYPSGQFTTFGPVQYHLQSSKDNQLTIGFDIDPSFSSCLSPISPIGPTLDFPPSCAVTFDPGVLDSAVSPTGPFHVAGGGLAGIGLDTQTLDIQRSGPSFSANGSTIPIQNLGPLHSPLRLDTIPVNTFTMSSVQCPVQVIAHKYTVIDQLIPSQGPLNGGIDITIIGAGFQSDTAVQFGKNLSETTFYSSTMLMCKLPPSLVPGMVDVRLVTSLNNTCYATMTELFKYID